MSNYGNNGYKKGGYGGGKQQSFAGGGSIYRKNALSKDYQLFADNGKGGTARFLPEFKGNKLQLTVHTNMDDVKPLNVTMNKANFEEFFHAAMEALDRADGTVARMNFFRVKEKGSQDTVPNGQLIMGTENGSPYIMIYRYKQPEIKFPFPVARFHVLEIEYTTGEKPTEKALEVARAKAWLRNVHDLVGFLAVTEFLTPEEIQELMAKRNGGGGNRGGYGGGNNNRGGGGNYNNDDDDDTPF